MSIKQIKSNSKTEILMWGKKKPKDRVINAISITQHSYLLPK